MDMQSPDKKRDNRTMILVAIIILLIAGNIYLYWQLNNKQGTVELMVQQQNMDSVRIADLDMKYNSALTDIEGLRGQNSSLDSLLNIKENDIKTMKAALDAAKKDGKLKDKEYLAKLNDLQNLVNDLKAQIAQLEQDKNILITQKEELGRNLDQKVIENTQLKTENTVQRTKLALLEAKNIVATGVKGKGKGKEVATTSAKKSERIKICFDVDANKDSDRGSKTFLLRLVNPAGAILNVASLGGGNFQMAETNEQMVYTTKATISYSQKAQNVCIYWGATGTNYDKGKYTAELYQDGYKVGAKDFELK